MFEAGERIFRSVNAAAAPTFAALERSRLLDELVDAGLALPARLLPLQSGAENGFAGPRGEIPVALIEHPRLRFVTYPYEWCFSQLKDAAVAHLDLQIAALHRGFVLSDATPYNMQFHEGVPVHIDTLSLRAYREGELWQGYNQFCRLFLAPLLIEAWTGAGFQPMLRGRLEGLPIAEAARLLPRRRLFTSLQGFVHIFLHGMAQARSASRTAGVADSSQAMPKPRYLALLSEMRRFIAGLESRKRAKSFWRDYAELNSYSSETRSRKAAIVRDFVAKSGVQSVVDIGGNTGDYARLALEAGASVATVLDGDNDAIEAAYARSKLARDGLSAWLVDIADPSPALGWRGRERESLTDRLRVDGVLALAVIHHMCVGRNIPLRSAVHWLAGLAPRGLIEFVPKSDPMVVQMLRSRDDPFGDYDLEHFLAYLGEVAAVVARSSIEGTDRILVEYAPHS